ncbi:MAG: hydantoinase/oxoprolinase family protein [Chloroflexota bacterium]|nr:MAG: hydantoinase/oxoprolinase family protein [Chloroflexota bacterium]
MIQERTCKIIGCDAGGTMTDMVVVDETGDFRVGKAATTPKDESIGYWESLIDATSYWGIDWQKQAKQILPDVESCVYSGTAMLNVLLTRRGKNVGIICTKGQEDVLLHERSKSCVSGYSYPDRLHTAAHVHNRPLVPKRLIKGVRERISVFGEPVIPLYEHEVVEAAEELLAEGIHDIVIWFLQAYINPAHEKLTAEIVREVAQKKGVDVTLYVCHEIAPIMREVSRLYSVLWQAYGAEPARKQLLSVEKKLNDNGFGSNLQVVLASGGVADARYPRLFEACFSGPIGGIFGGQFLAESMGVENLVCADLGGTSFDVGLIMHGQAVTLREVELGHFILNIPSVVMDSIGAGMGMFSTVDPETRMINLGPGSVGADPGPVCYDMGNTTATVMDCSLILGIVNPDYYLGGKVKLRTDLAYDAVKQQADVLGIDPYRYAEGVLEIIAQRMREHIKTVIAVRGYSPADYHLIGYGGAGPMLLAAYTEGLPLKGVFTVPWAAAFSAYGCCTLDLVTRYQKSTVISVPPGADENTKAFIGSIVNATWDELEQRAWQEKDAEGCRREDVRMEQIAYLRYGMQLEDLEVVSPVSRINSAEDLDKLIAAFEEFYAKVYTEGAKAPEMGYGIYELGIRTTVVKPKPRLPKLPLEGKAPGGDAFKGQRKVYVAGEWKTANIYEMDLLRPGNEVSGLAIIESPATTFPVPEGKTVRMDEHMALWLI